MLVSLVSPYFKLEIEQDKTRNALLIKQESGEILVEGVY